MMHAGLITAMGRWGGQVAATVLGGLLLFSGPWARGEVGPGNFVRPPSSPPQSGHAARHEAIPPARLTNEFAYTVAPLGSGLYDGQYLPDSSGQPKPDGSGVLLLVKGAHRQEIYSGWWNMGTPENGEYRFANGWKWYGDFSDRNAIGPLHAGETWLPGLTFEEATLRANAAQPPLEAVPPPPPGTAADGSNALAQVVVFTDPGLVKVTFVATNQQVERATDEEGNLQVGLPPGNYHLICEKVGCVRKERDLNVAGEAGRMTFCRVKLEPEFKADANVVDRSGDIKRVIGAENFPFMLGQVSPDTFAFLVRDRAGKIQAFLKNWPAGAPPPEVAREVAGFWRQVRQAALSGYISDCSKARQWHLLDGNRRYLVVALGATVADFAMVRTEVPGWGEEYVFPFPKSDGIQALGKLAVAAGGGTNYLWVDFPDNVLEQSPVANLLPRQILVSLEEGVAEGSSSPARPLPVAMVLVPNPKGSVRLPRNNGQPLKDRDWQPEDPFYLAVSETSFGQMRLYARWAEQQIRRHPEQAQWFVPIPVTKPLVGDQNLPYTGATPDEALSFCNWLSFCHGREPAYMKLANGRWTLDRYKGGFRLPDECEWEYAARFGFDFLASPGRPQWKEIKKQFNEVKIGEEPDRRLVYFHLAGPAGVGPRAVDDQSAWLYPLGVRDLGGNVGELCQAANSPAEGWLGVVCGGQYNSSWEGAVMPWSSRDFDAGNDNREVGFRVELPVPLDDFLNE